jgi:hypothetical protein
MGLRRTAGILLLGALLLWIPWAILVYISEIYNGDFFVTIAIYIVIIIPFLWILSGKVADVHWRRGYDYAVLD